MSTLYSIEESLERAVIAILEADSILSDTRIVSADDSDEDTLPCIYVKAERLDEVVRGMQTWNCRLTISLCASADDEGSEGFKAFWKALSDLVDADKFITDLNASELVKVWGLEFDPVAYEKENRSFSRSINARLWCNEAHPES